MGKEEIAGTKIERTVLQQMEIPGTTTKLVLGLALFPAEADVAPHTHSPGLIIQVIAGEYWIELQGQPRRFLHPGDSFIIPDGVVHQEGALGKEVKLSGIFILPKEDKMLHVKD